MVYGQLRLLEVYHRHQRMMGLKAVQFVVGVNRIEFYRLVHTAKLIYFLHFGESKS
jgi:hypothetical protein